MLVRSVAGLLGVVSLANAGYNAITSEVDDVCLAIRKTVQVTVTSTVTIDPQTGAKVSGYGTDSKPEVGWAGNGGAWDSEADADTGTGHGKWTPAVDGAPTGLKYGHGNYGTASASKGASPTATEDCDENGVPYASKYGSKYGQYAGLTSSGYGNNWNGGYSGASSLADAEVGSGSSKTSSLAHGNGGGPSISKSPGEDGHSGGPSLGKTSSSTDNGSSHVRSFPTLNSSKAPFSNFTTSLTSVSKSSVVDPPSHSTSASSSGNSVVSSLSSSSSSSTGSKASALSTGTSSASSSASSSTAPSSAPSSSSVSSLSGSPSIGSSVLASAESSSSSSVQSSASSAFVSSSSITSFSSSGLTASSTSSFSISVPSAPACIRDLQPGCDVNTDCCTNISDGTTCVAGICTPVALCLDDGQATCQSNLNCCGRLDGSTCQFGICKSPNCIADLADGCNTAEDCCRSGDGSTCALGICTPATTCINPGEPTVCTADEDCCNYLTDGNKCISNACTAPPACFPDDSVWTCTSADQCCGGTTGSTCTLGRCRPPPEAPSCPVTNGGFENIPPESLNSNQVSAGGWTGIDSTKFQSVAAGDRPYTTPYGDGYVLFETYEGFTSAVYQTISLTGGTTYTLTFAYAIPDHYVLYGECVLSVSFDGTGIQSFTLPDQNLDWTASTPATFTPAADTTGNFVVTNDCSTLFGAEGTSYYFVQIDAVALSDGAGTPCTG